MFFLHLFVILQCIIYKYTQYIYIYLFFQLNVEELFSHQKSNQTESLPPNNEGFNFNNA